jgi:hypothetical protein
MTRAATTIGILLTLAACASRAEDPSSSTEDVTAADAKVEIKMALAEADTGPALLGADPKDAELREVTFYDTVALSLFDRGIILRARQVEGDDDDATVKLRPFVESDVAGRFLAEDDFKCELDKSVGKDATSSCSFTTIANEGEIARAASGQRPIEGLFTNEQLAFLGEHAPGGAPDWSSVKALGPIPAEVWKLEPDAMDGEKVTIERWSLPGAAPSLEVSVKVKGKDAAEAERALVAWVSSRGLTASSAQESKTRTALEALTKGAATYR